MNLFDRIINKDLLVRRITVATCKLVRESDVKNETVAEQISLFDDPVEKKKREQAERQALEQEKQMQKTIIGIKKRFGKNVFALLDSEAEKVPPASDGLLFLPYLIGERCPVYDPDALGGFFGLNMLHTKGHFARSVMEGVAFALRQIYDEMTGLCGVCPSEIVLAGGGASSPLWRRIFAGVFDLPVYTVSGSRQGGSFAAALVASVTAGIFPSLDEAMNTVKVLTRDFPDENDVRLYAEGYEKYKRLYGSMKWLWEKQ